MYYAFISFGLHLVFPQRAFCFSFFFQIKKSLISKKKSEILLGLFQQQIFLCYVYDWKLQDKQAVFSTVCNAYSLKVWDIFG